ncbi:hypothetical protein [Streptomyces chromofuscus]|uniref:Uncharacterized protein n=1 Tax=Streptomyces chromofuscus TaxID=42881 RepID=A0A7M2T329_STRCW|nr:hypothetical protein [Streptomyces chromofuscus]QOV42982.1 hypothetical protein IPT68_24790 [Streptomyces chromofuscus]GGS92700.1 hypothetical protein GCM10010254_10770 [Streptomyces chromofuscus]
MSTAGIQRDTAAEGHRALARHQPSHKRLLAASYGNGTTRPWYEPVTGSAIPSRRPSTRPKATAVRR